MLRVTQFTSGNKRWANRKRFHSTLTGADNIPKFEKMPERQVLSRLNKPGLTVLAFWVVGKIPTRRRRFECLSVTAARKPQKEKPEHGAPVLSSDACPSWAMRGGCGVRRNAATGNTPSPRPAPRARPAFSRRTPCPPSNAQARYCCLP